MSGSHEDQQQPTSRWFGKLTTLLGMNGEQQEETTKEKIEKGREYYGRMFKAMSPPSSPPPSFDQQDDEDLPRELSQQEQAVMEFKEKMKVEELLTAFLGDWMEADLDVESVDIAGAFAAYAEEAQEQCSVRKERIERREAKKHQRFIARSSHGGKKGKKSNASGGDPDLYTDIEIPSLKTFVNITKILKAIDEYDETLAKSESETGRMKKVPAFPLEFVKDVEKVYDHILLTFSTERYKRMYGYTKQDHCSPALRTGAPVPSYFANVKDQSIHRRKVLSIAGLRNLVANGSLIYTEMQDKLFNGDPSGYSADKGVGKMKKLTGNVVDLDTCVLRPSDTLTMKAINSLNKKKGGKVWSGANDFGESEQAFDIAETAAEMLLTQFVNDYSLTEEQAKARNVSPSQFSRPIPLAKSNTDRGKWPIWHYVNVGQNSFHANVPNISDVNGALLKVPLHCVRTYLQVHSFPEEELQDWLDKFYEDAVADSCFNMKWKAVEEFALTLESHGTITDILQRLSVKHQQVFSSIMDDDDELYTKEKSAMWGFVSAGDLHGKSVKDGGKFRVITREDVEKWVDEPSLEI
eukprot:TRINITY_DN362_c4_g1_i1.p1 TRINITY_DN362_c4_g1~~TRINITY_DN362_c4_g1_i1.p1  ORF type:complete len:596 (+),score=127.76 TRINITY_DN362_c4_g1_i1:52-1788(+)